MPNRLTESWVRNFINASKQLSFQDKMDTIRTEPNPYYLLEWLVIDEMKDDQSIWEALGSARTPGMDKNKTLFIEACFRDQMLPDLFFCATQSSHHQAAISIACNHIKAHYGEDIWFKGVRKLNEQLQDSSQRYQMYLSMYHCELDKMNEQCAVEIRALHKEAEQYAVGEFDLAGEKRKVRASWERRKNNLPNQLLQKMFPKDIWLNYLVTCQIPNAEQRLNHVISLIQDFATHVTVQWSELLICNEMSELLNQWKQTKDKQSNWGTWFSLTLSHHELLRGSCITDESQRMGLRWLCYIIANNIHADEEHWWFETSYRARGWEGLISNPEFSAPLLHRFVWAALKDEDHKKRIREKIILQHWEIYASRFYQSSEDDFESLSWILILEPENIQQRLLRGENKSFTQDEVVRKLCHLYAESLRREIEPNQFLSLYSYLALHDKETLYAFLHGMKTLNEAFSIMVLPSSLLSQLFRGEGVRQEAARKQLTQLFFNYLDEPSFYEKKDVVHLQKLSQILSYDKRMTVVGWLKRHENDWRDTVQLGKGELSFTRLLRFRWIGTNNNVVEQHRTIKEWLQRHSDWVQFERDMPLLDEERIVYRIIKPGAIDAETGELIARVTVRAEYKNQSEVTRVLDDLKLL